MRFEFFNSISHERPKSHVRVRSGYGPKATRQQASRQVGSVPIPKNRMIRLSLARRGAARGAEDAAQHCATRRAAAGITHYAADDGAAHCPPCSASEHLAPIWIVSSTGAPRSARLAIRSGVLSSDNRRQYEKRQTHNYCRPPSRTTLLPAHRWNALGIASKMGVVGLSRQNSTTLRTFFSRLAGETSYAVSSAAWNP